ncbi:MAG: RluA family pseudouridine synthase [Erysipelotrichaceae bacterium]
MKRRLDYVCSDASSILTFLIAQGYSEAVCTHLRKQWGWILLNDQPVNIQAQCNVDDQLTIILEEVNTSDMIANPLPLSILWEDEDILVLDKPHTMPIQPSRRHPENTLANAVVAYYQQQAPFVYRCVNRLDHETTGATMIAKNMLASALLAKQVQNKTLQRTYLALVEGIPPTTFTIDRPIARRDNDTIVRCIDEIKGETARTHGITLASYRKEGLIFSLCELRLETGRTHQIRVHMQSIHHPLLGDELYGGDTSYLSNVALHSKTLRFTHPILHQPMMIEASLPDQLQNFLHQATPL